MRRRQVNNRQNINRKQNRNRNAMGGQRAKLSAPTTGIEQSDFGDQLRPRGRLTATGPVPNSFPSSMRTLVAYETLTNIDVSETKSAYRFRGNSLYDVDYTSTGHQPRYFDVYSMVYGRYRVLASAIHVDVIDFSADSAMLFAVIPHTDVLTFTSWEQVAEIPYAKTGKFVSVASRLPQQISHSITTSRCTGLRNKEVMDEDWAAPVTSNPDKVWYWNICIMSSDTTDYVSVNMRVRLVYDVVFYDRIEPAVSRVLEPEKHSAAARVKTQRQAEEIEKSVQSPQDHSYPCRCLPRGKTP